MKHTLSINRPRIHALASAATLILLAVAMLTGRQSHAQEIQTTQAPRAVIETYQVQSGGKTITFQRLAPRAVETVPVEPVAAPVTQAASKFTPPANWSPPISLSLGATIYENGVSELAWYHEGAAHRVLSSMDFSFVAGLGQFQWQGKNYLVFIAPSKAPVAQAFQPARLTPQPVFTPKPPPQLPSEVQNAIAQDGQSRFVITQAPAGGASDARTLNALAALHAYYDANRAALIAKHEAAEAQRKAQEEYLKAHPPVEQPVVIQFWPKRGSRYLNQSTTNAATTTSGNGEGAK
jgi:hypothetical protein